MEIKKVKNEWTISNTLHLNEYAPESIATDAKGNFLIVTNDKLIKIDNHNRITTLISNGFWKKLLYFPVTIAIKENIAYLGMRKGVFKYSLKTKKQEWLMKD